VHFDGKGDHALKQTFEYCMDGKGIKDAKQKRAALFLLNSTGMNV